MIVTGRWVVNLLEAQFTEIPFPKIWVWLRFLILFPLMFLFVQLIYMVTTPTRERKFQKGIGALAASVVIVLASVGFSWIMSQTNRYTLVYGSLASVVVLMIWLFVTGIILIMGNTINVIIDRRKQEKYNTIDQNIAE